MHHLLIGWLGKSLCNHAVPYNILTYLNNHANSQCLVNYVCPRTVTADDLAPFHSKNPDEKRANPCIRKLASIPAVVSQNVTYKSCLVCVKSEKYASLVTLGSMRRTVAESYQLRF